MKTIYYQVLTLVLSLYMNAAFAIQVECKLTKQSGKRVVDSFTLNSVCEKFDECGAGFLIDDGILWNQTFAIAGLSQKENSLFLSIAVETPDGFRLMMNGDMIARKTIEVPQTLGATLDFDVRSGVFRLRKAHFQCVVSKI